MDDHRFPPLGATEGTAAPDPRPDLEDEPETQAGRGTAAWPRRTGRAVAAWTREWGGPVLLVLGVVALGLAAVTFVVMLIVALVVVAFRAVVAAGQWVVDGVVDAGVMQTIYDPLRSYLQAHSAGLPMSAGTVAAFWALAQAVLLAWAWAGSWGARVGWTVCGALTVAAVWAGTVPASSRWTAAGVAVVVWSLLSIAAFRGAFRRARVVVVPTVDRSDDRTD